MNRQQKLYANMSMAIGNQIVVLICGFVLPRLILVYYGSNTNGLVSSITQFLNLISFLELGVGVVVQSALYKPLAENDNQLISEIISSANKFFRRVAVLLLFYVIGLTIIYPLFVNNSFDFGFTASLIVVMSISSFAQYYFGITNQLLLNADQKSYVQLATQAGTLILNTCVCTILMINGASIQFVKLSTSLIFLLRPLILSIYVKKNYNINKKISLTYEPIQQKWNGLAQHIAYIVLINSPMVILTLFSDLKNVSIYTVYNLVANGLNQLIMSIRTGVPAMFGNMIANGEMQELKSAFKKFEWSIHTLVVFVFTLCGILILPFVKIYTAGIHDADYQVPVFAYIFILAQASYCLRIPYNMIVMAAGHYKQTQSSAIIEATINIVISVVLVRKFGLVGVAIGTLVAMLYRSGYFAIYISRNIIFHKLSIFLKHIAIDILSVLIMIMACSWIHLSSVSYIAWIIMALKAGVICGIITVLVNYIFYRNYVIETIATLTRKGRRNKVK